MEIRGIGDAFVSLIPLFGPTSSGATAPALYCSDAMLLTASLAPLSRVSR